MSKQKHSALYLLPTPPRPAGGTEEDWLAGEGEIHPGLGERPAEWRPISVDEARQVNASPGSPKCWMVVP